MNSKMNMILLTDEEANELSYFLGQRLLGVKSQSKEETIKMITDFYDNPLSNSILEKITFGMCVSGTDEERKEWAKCYGQVQFGRKGYEY